MKKVLHFLAAPAALLLLSLLPAACDDLFLPDQPAGPPADAYDVSDAREHPGETDVWVQGYIVGGLTKDGAVDFDCDTALTATALVIADRADCRTPAECAVLNLTKAAHKQALGLDNPANKPAVFHRKIYAQGKATTYKKFPALTNLCQYQLE